ncbi:hypothetical protein ACJJIE_03480 [Microbulbifer sp. TRSA001]|uniref:hypothetical protein n=1 Tax=Microbulbifer sp. TRSA001 TaxID=3243381 RepID=UPI00403A6EAF
MNQDNIKEWIKVLQDCQQMEGEVIDSYIKRIERPLSGFLSKIIRSVGEKNANGDVEKQIKHAINVIDYLAVTNSNDYSAVRKDEFWKRAYLYHKGIWYRMTKNGEIKMSGEEIELGVCHECAIVLPSGQLEVDHYLPQSGSGILPILKAMRACGMTLGGPKGSGKGNLVLDGKIDFLGVGSSAGNNIKTEFTGVKNSERGIINPHVLKGFVSSPKGKRTQKLLDAKKYTPSILGVRFLKHLLDKNMLIEIRRRCMHSILNLAPLCPTCNNCKSNKIKGFPGDG